MSEKNFTDSTSYSMKDSDKSSNNYGHFFIACNVMQPHE